MPSAGIRELKAKLSHYLRLVARGQTVVVTDRGRVVAEVRPPGSSPLDGDPAAVRYRELVAARAIRPALRPNDRVWATASGVGLPAGTAQSWLDLDRDE